MPVTQTIPDRLLAPAADWAALRAGFRWPLPARMNIAELCCTRWARRAPARVAMQIVREDGPARAVSYAALERDANRLAHVLAAQGVGRGDRVAVVLPQMLETVLTHVAAYKLGAIVVPLFTLFGEDGLLFRLADSGAAALVTDAANLPKITALRDRLPDLATVLCTDGPGPGALAFWPLVARAADTPVAADTGPEDPAFLSYTSGTTGPPKGALHGHRVLLGHLPGVELHHNFLPQPGDRLWTPADWAWMGGLANVMLPALFYGVPLVAYRMAKFDPDRAVRLMADLGIRNVFLPPTALKLMRQAPPPRGLGPRSVASGGEALGAEMLDWGRGVFGVEINEFYGQTECNLVLSNCAAVALPVPGAMGRAVPGHDVAVLGGDGTPLPPGETGEIAVRRPDPGMFLEYWNRPDKTAEKFRGDWMLTGDTGRVEADGLFRFSARTDDVITSSGYRIGPSEIEDCLTGHPGVAMAAVVGLPDPVRTEYVCAFVVPRDGGSPALGKALIAHVRARLSPHVAPREVRFVADLPMTATGKIMRRALKEGA
ncbi:MAG: AMP-binding protein [Pseudomonadota bacterium]